MVIVSTMTHLRQLLQNQENTNHKNLCFLGFCQRQQDKKCPKNSMELHALILMVFLTTLT